MPRTLADQTQKEGMIRAGKYIAVSAGGVESAILFPGAITHQDMFAALQLTQPDMKAVSAGYLVAGSSGQFSVRGGCEHMALQCRTQDLSLLNQLLTNQEVANDTVRKQASSADVLGAKAVERTTDGFVVIRGHAFPRSEVVRVNNSKAGGGIVVPPSELVVAES